MLHGVRTVSTGKRGRKGNGQRYSNCCPHLSLLPKRCTRGKAGREGPLQRWPAWPLVPRPCICSEQLRNHSVVVAESDGQKSARIIKIGDRPLSLCYGPTQNSGLMGIDFGRATLAKRSTATVRAATAIAMLSGLAFRTSFHPQFIRLRASATGARTERFVLIGMANAPKVGCCDVCA